MNKIKSKFTEKQLYLLAGLFFFFYSLAVGLLIQLYVTPEFFPQLTEYHNLVVFDSQGFDHIARIKAAQINEFGWTAWELRPKNLCGHNATGCTTAHSPAGIASIFYAIFTDEPYSVLPYNALVHALSGCIVLWLLLKYFSWLPAVVGSLVFVLNPTALEWVTQIHRDGLFVLGNLMLLMSLLILSEWKNIDKDHNMLHSIISGLVGVTLIWVTRPYWLPVFVIIIILWVVFSFIFICFNNINIHNGTYKIIKVFALSIIILSQVYLLKPSEYIKTKVFPVIEKPDIVDPEVAKEDKTGIVVSDIVVDKPVMDKKRFLQKTYWINSRFFPNFIEFYFNRLYSIRLGVFNAGGDSVVDKEVPMNSMESYFAYLPRALQVGLFSPLPNLWSGEGSNPTYTIARKVMRILTPFFYIFLLGFLIMIIKNKTNFELWVITGFCLIGVLVFTYGYPNIGTLIRFRYAFHALLMSLGMAQIISMIVLWREKKIFF